MFFQKLTMDICMKKYLLIFIFCIFFNIFAEEKPDFSIKHLTFDEAVKYCPPAAIGPYYLMVTKNFPLDQIVNIKTRNLLGIETDMGNFKVFKDGMIKRVDFLYKPAVFLLLF